MSGYDEMQKRGSEGTKTVNIKETIQKIRHMIIQAFRSESGERRHGSGIMRILVTGVFLVFLAVATELCMTIDFNGFFASCSFSHTEYHVSNLETVNCKVNGRTFTTTSDHPQLYIENINDYVGNIQICLDDLSVSTLDVSVYYSEDGLLYEEKSVNGTFREDSGCLLLSLKQDVSSIRIEPGISEGISFSIANITLNPHVFSYVINSMRNLKPVRILIYFLILSVFYLAVKKPDKFKYVTYKYRWVIGAALVVLCTVLKLHGSSVGSLTKSLSGADTSRLWGTERGIRSDEYVAFTQMALSQVKSGFKWFSDIWGYSPSDMFIVYGQPVSDPVTVFRPFSLGYIFMGAEYGLSFYWSSRLIFLFLISFEFGRLISRDNRKLSVLYAFLISFSPLVQWWYSVNGLVEMVIYGQALILLIKMFFETPRLSRKMLFTAGMVICAGGYILTLYPAWMVPFAYVFAACFLAFIIENRKNIKITGRDIVILSAGIVILAASMIYIYVNSSETIAAVMNTVYPGQRRYTGGPPAHITELFRGWTSWVWSFTDCSNPCEEAGFLSFFPMGIILSVYLFIKEKKKDIWLIVLNICNLLLIVYFLIPLPEIFSKITLLGYSSHRMVNAIGLVNLLILIRALTVYEGGIKTHILILFAFIIAGFSYVGVSGLINAGTRFLVLILIIVSCVLICECHKKAFLDIFAALVISVSIAGGFLVNPVESGLSTFYNSYVVQSIAGVNSEDPGTWFVNGSWKYENLPAAVGADCISALETYPDAGLWEKLELTDDADIWNRYSHMTGSVGDSTYVELPAADSIRLSITIDDLKKLGVKYIFSESEMDDEENLELMDSYKQYHIYKITGTQ